MHAVEVSDRSSAGLSLAAAERLQDVADILILDTGSTEAIGATGIPHDWDVSRQIVRLSRLPVILAGGLHPENVAEAVRAVRPWGVDSFTGTNHYREDGSHYKDIALVRSFCKAATGAAESCALP